MIPDDDDPAIAYDALDPAGAPVIPDDADPAILDAITSEMPGDGNSVIPGADALKRDGVPAAPDDDAPM